METVNLGNSQGSVGAGDTVIMRGEYRRVVMVHTEPPGRHNRGTVVKDMTAVVVTAADGKQRAFGARRAWVDSDLRMHWER